MRLLLGVLSCVKDEPRHSAIFDTWGRQAIARGMDLFFFTGPVLSCPDDYASLGYKTRAMCQWAYHRDYDYVAKIDTDTYVHIDRLLASGFEKHDYSGYVRPEYTPEYAYGPLYWLSRKALGLVAASPKTCPYEDMLVGEILAPHGITPHHDLRYSHWFPVFPQNDRIMEHLNSTGGYSDARMYQAHKNAHAS